MFVNVYRQILSLHLSEWCIMFVCLDVKALRRPPCENSPIKVKYNGI